jgi:hypothetical protein
MTLCDRGGAIKYGTAACQVDAEPWNRAAGDGRTHKQETRRAVCLTNSSEGHRALSMPDDGGGCLLLLAAAGDFVRLRALPWC